MKRINYAGVAIITSDAVSAALLDYAVRLIRTSDAVAVDIPVLEENGTTKTHTVLLGPGVQLDVSDVDGLDPEEENERFPVPDFRPIGAVAVVPSTFEGWGTQWDQDLGDASA
jgi:hypothetical protein